MKLPTLIADGSDIEGTLRDGALHGPWRRYYPDGQLLHETAYVVGKEHGTARQYDESGNLIGSYQMDHGTGLDLWYSAAGVLAEERGYRDGERHGYERWWNEDNRTVFEEGHFWRGEPHGIMRQWIAQGRLRRGYPQYFVHGNRVTKRHYQRACLADPTLPAWRAEDDQPQRPLPEAMFARLSAAD
jgi:antitoxin component YwqK of YwqJK toxin-antitoxin module